MRKEQNPIVKMTTRQRGPSEICEMQGENSLHTVVRLVIRTGALLNKKNK
jgi:hypothetical protein